MSHADLPTAALCSTSGLTHHRTMNCSKRTNRPPCSPHAAPRPASADLLSVVCKQQKTLSDGAKTWQSQEEVLPSYSNFSQGSSSSVCLFSFPLLIFLVSSVQLMKLHLQVAPANMTHARRGGRRESVERPAGLLEMQTGLLVTHSSKGTGGTSVGGGACR